MFCTLKIINNPKKTLDKWYWLGNGWNNTYYFFNSIKLLCKGFFFLVSANERITMDNQQWINVHVYLIKHWRQIPILLSLEHMEVSAITNSITIILLKCMVKYGRILCDELGLRWVCLNCYGNFVFQELCFQVTSQFKSKVVFFSMCVQVAHQTNLAIYCVIQITFLVSCIESML